MLLREIHHRVKNNLQIISSLLNLQSKKIKDDRVLSSLRDSQNRVRSMALIHQKLYDAQDLVMIDFAGYTRGLTATLFSSYGISSSNITLDVQYDDISLDINLALPCGLIINELVSNSLNHAFAANKGVISVHLQSDGDNKVALTVSDNGTGFPEGLDFRNTDSLGLQLLNSLARQLKGTIELDRSAGTAFTLRFPIPDREGDG